MQKQTTLKTLAANKDVRVGDIFYTHSFARELSWGTAIRFGFDAFVVRKVEKFYLRIDAYRFRKSVLLFKKSIRVARKIV